MKKRTAIKSDSFKESIHAGEQYIDKAHGYIQWKGTDVCMDYHCVCGASSHIDSDFCYHVRCDVCGRVFFCNGNIELIEAKYDANCVCQGDVWYDGKPLCEGSEEQR